MVDVRLFVSEVPFVFTIIEVVFPFFGFLFIAIFPFLIF